MDKTVQATEQANNASTIQVTVRSSISGETMLGRPVVMVSTAQVANLRRCVARDVYCSLPFQLVLLHEQKPLEGCEHDAMYKTPNGKKHSFFLPMKRAHLRSSNPLGKGAYDPQEFKYDLRPVKITPTTHKPACQKCSYEPHQPR